MTETLRGRVALVTGVGRRGGIAFAVAARLLDLGADLFLTHHHAHDLAQPWGGEDEASVLDALRALAPERRVESLGADLADPQAPRAVIDAAVAAFGAIDLLICVHARSGADGSLLDCDAAMLDGHWAVNTRSTLLLTRYFAEQFRAERWPGVEAPGRVVWFTSGQGHGPMVGEVAYATSKAALAGIAVTVAEELIDDGILLNVVNPGPVDTGYLDPALGAIPAEVIDELRTRMPLGRFGQPDDPARLVAWLVSDAGRWVVGQVLTSEGGFRRYQR